MAHTKYIKYTNSKGFTLVELIVVITILVVLGTISFLSFQGFASDARDSRRSSDLSNISQAINIAMISGKTARMFLTTTTTGTIINNGTGTSTQLRIGGNEGYNTLSGSYAGGEVNYAALGIKKEDFSDPTKKTEAYKMGVTDYDLPQYEIAATVENKGNPDTLISGTWNPRLGSISYSGDCVNDTISLIGKSISDTNLRLNDIVRFGTGETDAEKYRIIGLSRNIVQVDRAISPTGKIFLHRDETRHLIRRWITNSAIDIGAGGDYIPYQLN